MSSNHDSRARREIPKAQAREARKPFDSGDGGDDEAHAVCAEKPRREPREEEVERITGEEKAAKGRGGGGILKEEERCVVLRCVILR